MKKVFLVCFLCIGISAASFAQARIGGMLGYGSETEQWGLGVNGEFFFHERMAITPSLFFYFPETHGGFKFSYWEANGDFHYYFLSQDVVSLYGLAGLNLTTAKVRRDNNFIDGGESSNSEAGINLGFGANLKLGSIIPFGELKYVAGDIDQAVLFVGLKFPLRD